jgi:hypothetical protein
LFLDEGRPVRLLGGPRPHTTRHPLGKVVVVFSTVETDVLVMLAPVNRMARVLHANDRSTCDANARTRRLL